MDALKGRPSASCVISVDSIDTATANSSTLTKKLSKMRPAIAMLCVTVIVMVSWSVVNGQCRPFCTQLPTPAAANPEEVEVEMNGDNIQPEGRQTLDVLNGP